MPSPTRCWNCGVFPRTERQHSTPAYVETWKGIAAHCGRSERWCKYAADGGRNVDRLPVFKVCGLMRMDLDAYEAWLERQRDRRPAPPPVERPRARRRDGEAVIAIDRALAALEGS
jgi:predicted membrane metal-binding protein